MITRHPQGVIVNGRLFKRDAYYAASYVSVREWTALGVVLIGLALWVSAMVGGLAWLVLELLHRWQ